MHAKLSFVRPSAPDSPEEAASASSVTPPTTAGDEVPAKGERTPGISVYRLRRGALAFLVIAGLAGAVYFANRPQAPVSTVYGPAASVSTSAGPQAEMQQILAAGKSWQSTHASFDGFILVLPKGARVGAAGPGMVASVQSGSTCLYSGVLPSGVKPVLTDPTGSACTDSLVAQAKASLAAQATQATESTSTKLASLDQAAVRDVRNFATMASPVTPDLSGLPVSFGIPGVTVVARTSSSATLRIASSTDCEMQVVPANPSTTVPPPTAC